METLKLNGKTYSGKRFVCVILGEKKSFLGEKTLNILRKTSESDFFFQEKYIFFSCVKQNEKNSVEKFKNID